jgi:hypothetical protein
MVLHDQSKSTTLSNVVKNGDKKFLLHDEHGSGLQFHYRIVVDNQQHKGSGKARQMVDETLMVWRRESCSLVHLVKKSEGKINLLFSTVYLFYFLTFTSAPLFSFQRKLKKYFV